MSDAAVIKGFPMTRHWLWGAPIIVVVAGLTTFMAAYGCARIAVGGVVLDEGARVVAPPLVENRSLHVDPRRHVFATRDEIAFPPLSRFGARA